MTEPGHDAAREPTLAAIEDRWAATSSRSVSALALDGLTVPRSRT